MTRRTTPRPRAATLRRSLAMLATCLLIVWTGGRPTAQTPSDATAQANQLHAAIVNGDVESLKYWLAIRHADPAASNAAEPNVTPIERCLGLAARVLDARPGETAGAPPVSLRVLQEMVTLLHEHGARITDADREHFSGPVTRWYDDAVAPEPARPPSTPEAAPVAAPKPPAAPPPAGEPTVSLETHPVVITTNPREPCNGSGHTVYLVNHTQLSVTAKVTTHDEAASGANSSEKSASYTVDPDSPWRLGCDTTRDGRRVSYVLGRWK